MKNQIFLLLFFIALFIQSKEINRKDNPVQSYLKDISNLIIQKHTSLCQSSSSAECIKQQKQKNQQELQTCKKAISSFQIKMKQIQDRIMKISQPQLQLQMNKGLQILLDSFLSMKQKLIKAQCMKKIDKDYDQIVESWKTLKQTILLVRQKKQQLDQQEKIDILIQQL